MKKHPKNTSITLKINRESDIIEDRGVQKGLFTE